MLDRGKYLIGQEPVRVERDLAETRARADGGGGDRGELGVRGRLPACQPQVLQVAAEDAIGEQLVGERPGHADRILPPDGTHRTSGVAPHGDGQQEHARATGRYRAFRGPHRQSN